MTKSGIHLQGAAEIKKIMDALGPAISKRAGTTGLRKAALVMKNELKAGSPKRAGTLRRQWMIKKLRARRNSKTTAYTVRLRNLHYYETLEFDSKRGAAMRPFAERIMMIAKPRVFATMMAATRTALATEAGKAYARSKRAR